MPHQPEQENKIQSSFDLTLTDSNLQNLGVDFSEIAIDNVLDDGLLKEIPIVSTVVNLLKFGANVHDKLFIKKILAFLGQLRDVSPDERKKMITDIDDSKKYRIKVGEKLLYIIDTCDDYEIAELVGVLFKVYIEGRITYDEFIKTSAVLKRINKGDFDWFVKERERHHFDLDEIGDALSLGLFELHYEQISVHIEDETDKKTLMEGGGKYNTDVDGGVSAHLSRAGQIILEIFCPSYVKPKIVKL